MRRPLVVAVAQPELLAGDVRATADAHARLIHEADARLVVFPELSLTGYALDVAPITTADDGWTPIVDACAATGTTALVGAPILAGGSRSIATVAVTADGARVAYRKTFLSDDEARWFEAGPGAASIEVDGWRVGLGICKDTRIHEHVTAVLALDVDLYAAGLVHHDHEVDELARRAERIIASGEIPVAFASAAGDAGPAFPRTAGHSAIWAADGAVLARAGGATGEVVRATLTDRGQEAAAAVRRQRR